VIDESEMVDRSAMSPRAGVALLTLQLRSTLQAAVDAEAEVASLDADAALWQLRSKLGPLIEDRCRALDEDLRLERDRADAAVATARDQAAAMIADAQARLDEAVAERASRAEAAKRAAAMLAERQAASSATMPPPVADDGAAVAPSLFDDPLTDWTGGDPTLVSTFPPPAPTPLPAPPWLDAALEVPTVMSQPPVARLDESGAVPQQALSQPLHVVLDADSFARAFAVAMAPLIEARQHEPRQPMYPPGYVPMQRAPEKKSFWAHAWHPDVLLSGLAMVIVVIVLIAWAG
jgi:hypothetical protein